MKKIKERFEGYKLNTKITIICLLFILIPMTGLPIWLFRVMEDSLVNEKINAMEYRLSKNYDQIVTNIDAINMSTQFFLSDQGLRDFLISRKKGENYTTEELLAFYGNDIASLERMVNNNTSLYQVRVYVDDEDMQEMMPILYRKERMEGQGLTAGDGLYGWRFNYDDKLFSNYDQYYGKKILSLVTPIEVYGLGEIGIIETAMSMDVMFPMLYDSTEKEWSCFTREGGAAYFADGLDTEENQRLMEKILQENAETSEAISVYVKKDGKRHLIVGYQKIGELGGAFIGVDDFSGEMRQIYRQRSVYILAGLLLMALLAVAVNGVAKRLLGQFYSILHSIREVQKGDLDVVIENCGTDEMGELGSQINKMLVNIKQLTADNLNHELLMKNTQIRALQNQINAHFIYNVLESIKMMAEIEEKYDISDAITALGRLLRYSMRWTKDNVTIEEELDYVRNYLKLVNLRFDYEIYLSENIPEIILKQKIPKMSLQPVVENAIYHGIEQMAEDTNIYIKGIVMGSDCMIEITDAGRGMSEEEVGELYRKINGELEASGGTGNGIGLKNVQDRMKISFGEKYGIEIASKLGCYTKVMLFFPMTEKEPDLQIGGKQ